MKLSNVCVNLQYDVRSNWRSTVCISSVIARCLLYSFLLAFANLVPGMDANIGTTGRQAVTLLPTGIIFDSQIENGDGTVNKSLTVAPVDVEPW